ncbi:MAG: pyridoxal phosphate-dependent aminotransferase [Kiritimatiellae bacterium]|nr:pyridoxal phosphate-dependent aminotransferase [Kiritimatiellia bacterium]
MSPRDPPQRANHPKLPEPGEPAGWPSGIRELMDDLGAALGGRTPLLMLGGGNPARVAAAEHVWRRRMEELLREDDRFERLLGIYEEPQGSPAFREAVAEALRARYGWPLTAANVALTHGGQGAIFYLAHLLAGRRGRIWLPMTPEYIGYADLLHRRDWLVASRRRIELQGEREFKYRLSGDEPPPDAVAILLSRPTNPTGNVITDAELRDLAALAGERDIPLIVDGAYGPPFPDIVTGEVRPFWNERVIWLLSLSKLGLPGVRTGIVVAGERWAHRVAEMHAIAALAGGNLGPALVEPLLRSGELFDLCRRELRPFYDRKAETARLWLAEYWPADRPWRLHVREGAFFFWVWLPGLGMGSRELYRRLKERGVIVVSGHHFFAGADQTDPHRDECLRVSFAQPDEVVWRGLERIGAVIRDAWD